MRRIQLKDVWASVFGSFLAGMPIFAAMGLLLLSQVAAAKITVLERPKALSVEAGNEAVFSVRAKGDGRVKYQWYRGSDVISGANRSVLRLSNVRERDQGRYRVLIRDRDGKRMTSFAELRVKSHSQAKKNRLVASSLPKSKKVKTGEAAIFSVKASGSGKLSYQWKKNGRSIPGATSSVYKIASVSAGDQALYSVKVSDSNTSKWFGRANLSVIQEKSASPKKSEDVSLKIVSAPKPLSVSEGETAVFEVKAVGSGDLRYIWRRNGRPIPGQTGATLRISDVALSDAGAYNVKVMDDLDRTWSRKVRLKVGKSAKKGNPSEAAMSFSLQPVGADVTVGRSHTLNVAVNSDETLRYEWRKNGRTIPNAVGPYLEIAEAAWSDSGEYDVVVFDGKKEIVSRKARVNVVADTTASLSWKAPTERESGEALGQGDIAYYHIYHSSDEAQLENVYKVQKDQLNYELFDLAKGTHYFAVTVVDVRGLESQLSKVGSKVIW